LLVEPDSDDIGQVRQLVELGDDDLPDAELTRVGPTIMGHTARATLPMHPEDKTGVAGELPLSALEPLCEG